MVMAVVVMVRGQDPARRLAVCAPGSATIAPP